MPDLFVSYGSDLLSYLAIIIFLVLTGAGFPLPEEVAIVAAGVLAANGNLNPWLAVGSCLFGALAGDCLMYWLGYHFGRAFLRDHPWWARLIKPEREAKIEEMTRKHGFKVFFLARFLVGIRSPVYFSAGILRMSFRRFLLIDLVCATAVIGVFFAVSYFCGPALAQWIRQAEVLLTVVVVVVLLAAAVYLWRRHRRKAALPAASSLEPFSSSAGESGGETVLLGQLPSENGKAVEPVGHVEQVA